jgi:hypothetical protein
MQKVEALNGSPHVQRMICGWSAFSTDAIIEDLVLQVTSDLRMF